MKSYAWLVPLCPLLGALATATLGRRLKGNAHWPVVAGIGAAFCVSLLLLGSARAPGTTVVYEWLDFTGLRVPIAFRVDGLTTMMLSMVTFVATLVAIYAAGYMAGDPGYPRFFAVVGLFVFSMTGLVLSSNFVLTYAFWEGVGVCSYLLVGFWHAKPEAAAAAKKAFLVNRIGDYGFAIALFWMWWTFGGNLDYDYILNPANLASIPDATKAGIAFLLFWAATAKSAQIPLYVWLPDAMEGPTPVLGAHPRRDDGHGRRLPDRPVECPDRPGSPSTAGHRDCRVCDGPAGGALIALTQTDLKRVMAYSTVSQLGYMFMALGSGVGNVARFAVIAAMFHLFTHAFFKALLFLASGSVMHAMGGVIDMRRFRGLRHRLPYTCWTFAVGGLALAGIVPTAGFFSKDEVLSSLKMASNAAIRGETPLGHWADSIYGLIYWVAVFVAFLTAFYTGRAFFLTFFGPEKLPSPDDPEAETSIVAHAGTHGAAIGVDTPAPETADASAYDAAMGLTRPESTSHTNAGHGGVGESKAASDEPVGHGHGHGGHDDHFGHESPPLMWVPLVILAACALLVGLIFGPTEWFAHHLELTPGFEELPHPTHHGFDWATAAVGTIAALLGLALSYLLYAAPSAIPARIAKSVRPLYEASYRKFGVDTLYDFIVVGPTRLLAGICRFFDEHVVEGLVKLAAMGPRFLGREVLAPSQNGLIQFYAAATALAVVGLLLLMLFLPG